LRERVDACVSEESNALGVVGRDAGVVFYRLTAAEAGEVFLLVQPFEDRGCGRHVFFEELNAFPLRESSSAVVAHTV